MPRRKRPLRIVLTGGPGGGKSTVAELFQKELGKECVLVQEAATVVFSVGFPRADHAGAQRNCQRAIYYLQKNMEDAHAQVTSAKFIVCDRGTLDGAAYWPGGPTRFLKDMRTSYRAELSRYDAVIFLETAAVGGIAVRGGNNPHRFETVEEARALDRRVRRVWDRHKNFVLIPHEESFQSKLSVSLAALFRLIGR
ncbi:MAG: ATP-binding protein [Deltaproteobacteria bacterium]|nr:ATP-binding protein [Deltaproteobacteria bacterium]MBI3294401.1 ATP-binding protein [Deltaproteobacteria bacterium]